MIKPLIKVRIFCLAFLFWSGLLLAGALLCLAFHVGASKPAEAAEVIDFWPYPQTVTVSGAEPLHCPAGYRQMYAGNRTALLGWRKLPPPASPQVYRAPGRVCLDRDGGMPFYELAYVRETVDVDPCIFCVLGEFPTQD